MDCKCLRQIIVTGKDTEVIWPAITGYGDKTIVAYPNSSAHEYCIKYGEKYSLHFVNIKEYKKG